MKFNGNQLSLRRLRSRRGSMLAFAMMVTVMLAIMVIPSAQYMTQTTRMAFSTRGSDQAFYAAEAGVARALSYVFAVGNGAVTGIYDPRFQTTAADPFYPFGDAWMTLDEGVQIDNDAILAAKVSIWFDPTRSSWVVRSVGRSDRPRVNYRTVDVRIGAGTFARYAFFNSASLSAIDGERRWLAAGETFNGPVHSNRHLFVYGTHSPNNPLTFNSDVTIVNREVEYSNSNYQNVVYNGLKDTDAEYVEIPDDLTMLKTAAADGGLDLPTDDPWAQSAPPEFAANDPNPGIENYRFVFDDNGTVTYTNLDAAQYLMTQGVAEGAAHAQASTTVDIGSTNGAMIVRDGNVFVSGILNGQVTLAALANDANSALIPPFTNTRTDGNIIVEGNLIYSTHPKDGFGQYDLSDDRSYDPAEVTDVMGMIAERNFLVDGSMPSEGIIDSHVMVTGQASPNPDVRDWGNTTGKVNAAVSQDGAFYIEDGNQRDLSELWTGIPDSEPGSGQQTGRWKTGDLYLTGGVVHFLRGQTANGNGGFDRRYTFDSRLLVTPPPFYPMTPDLEIIGWRDVASVEEP